MYNNFNNRNNSMFQRQNNSSNHSQQTNMHTNQENIHNNMQQNNLNIDFTQNPRLRNIDPLKLKIINEIQRKSKNRSIEELLPEIMKINQELTRRNMSFSKEETAVLLDVIEENLSPDEKQRFAMLKSFLYFTSSTKK